MGVTGKYGTRYGASLRKVAKKIEISQRAKYTCLFCGKVCDCPPFEGRLNDGPGQHEAHLHWHLEVQGLPKGCCWRCLECEVSFSEIDFKKLCLTLIPAQPLLLPFAAPSAVSVSKSTHKLINKFFPLFLLSYHSLDCVCRWFWFENAFGFGFENACRTGISQVLVNFLFSLSFSSVAPCL